MRHKNPSRKGWLTDMGDAFVAHRLTMRQSPAWQAVPIPLRRILDRLELEHMRHGGKENGNLAVSYRQLKLAGVSERQMRAALTLGQRLGLLEVLQDPERSNGRVRPENVYRLTYVPSKGAKAPTDEWEFVSEEVAQAALAEFRRKDSESRSRQDDEEIIEGGVAA